MFIEIVSESNIYILGKIQKNTRYVFPYQEHYRLKLFTNNIPWFHRSGFKFQATYSNYWWFEMIFRKTSFWFYRNFSNFKLLSNRKFEWIDCLGFSYNMCTRIWGPILICIYCRTVLELINSICEHWCPLLWHIETPVLIGWLTQVERYRHVTYSTRKNQMSDFVGVRCQGKTYLQPEYSKYSMV